MPVTKRLQAWVCVVLAVCVLSILLLPIVPVPVTMLRAKHCVRPAHIPIAGVVLAAARQSFTAGAPQQLSARQARLATRGPDLVDLTTARLC